jgi:hypothetical protein
MFFWDWLVQLSHRHKPQHQHLHRPPHLDKDLSSLGRMRMIRIITDITATTMEAGITVMVAVMGEEEGIGTTIQMVVMRIAATTVGQIALGEVGVVGAGVASLLPL